MSLRQFVPDREDTAHSLVLVNSTAPAPVREMLVDLFEDQPVAVEEIEDETDETDTILLVEEGSVVATSPLAAVQNAVLLVNSDLFITGTRGLDELQVPDVIEGLAGVPFTLAGYPESDTEKLLLILVSRLIERRAVRADEGTLRASFQRLSRIKDEQGTKTVYEQLGESDVDTHVYGVPDWIPSHEYDVVTHGGNGENFRKAWFVLFEPTGNPDAALGLLAYEVRPRRWEGFYALGEGELAEAAAHVTRTM
ncbi:MAG: DICT sensory domain-containing protein [Halobacteriota archaeon]